MESTQELFKAYAGVMSSGFAVFNTGLQQNNAIVGGMIEANVKLAEANQAVMQSAINYGEALMEWSLENAKGYKG